MKNQFTESYCNDIINSLPNPYGIKIGSPIISNILQYVNDKTPYSFVCFSSNQKIFVKKRYVGKNPKDRFLLDVMLRLKLDVETINERLENKLVNI